MSDTELLENAARACGYKWSQSVYRFREESQISGLWVYGVSTAWDPLNDNGHALALAVKLRLDIRHSASTVYVGNIDNGESFALEPHGDNAESATCRAIVRAAAAIGIAMFGHREEFLLPRGCASGSVFQPDGESDAVRGHACRGADRAMVSTAAGQELIKLAIDDLKTNGGHDD